MNPVEMNSENKPAIPSGTPPRSENPYYIVKSKRFRYAFLAVLVVFIVFLVVTAVVFRREITLENFRYLLKDIELTGRSGSGDYQTVSYNENTTDFYTSYRGGFTVVNATGVTFFDTSGVKNTYSGINYANPVPVCSSKYLLLYGVGDNSYSIYNNFGPVFEETLPYPITSASQSSSGYYSIVSRAAEYRSAVYLYNPSFKKVWVFYKDKYVIDTAIDEVNKRVYCLYFFVENGDIVTELSWCGFDGDSSDEVNVTRLDGLMPVRLFLFSSSNVAVLTDSMILYYDTEGKELQRNAFGSLTPLTYSYTDERVLLIFRGQSVDGTCSLTVSHSSGTELYRKEEKGNLIATAGNGDCFAVLFGSKMILYDQIGQRTEFDVEQNPKGLVFPDENTLLVCYGSRAVRYSLSDEDAGRADG